MRRTTVCLMGVVAIALAVLTPKPSAAGETVAYWYAGDLKNLCASKDLKVNAMCDGYILGIFEVITNTPVYGYVACVPRGSTTSEALELVTDRLE